MRVTGAEFTRLVDPPDPELVLAVVIEVSDVETRGVPVLASVGDVDVEGLFPDAAGTGLIGFLAAEPPAGAELVVGYADAPIATGITYDPPIA